MTSISDLPDFSENDMLELQDIPNKITVEKINIKQVVSEDNLLVGIIILLLLYKPANHLINSSFNFFSNSIANVALKSICILILFILTKRFVIPMVML
jgi:hypothetical protein